MPRRLGDDESEDAFRLAGREMAVTQSSARDVYPVDYEDHPIAPTIARRLRSLARYEARLHRLRSADPPWSREGLIPGLIVAQRWAGGDAFGCARQIAELDTAMRRAAALIELFSSPERVEAWPRPIRPERGGLWLLDAEYGSLDALWTFYGILVSVATSTPVSLASFASLAWDSSKAASRMARRWVLRPLRPDELAHRPRATDQPQTIAPSGDTWQERTTRRLVPVLRQAVNNGQGLDFRVTGPGGEIRLIVTAGENPDE